MFLLCMKELPATLLLRPIGFDTLAVRIWLEEEASEELYQLAAPPALPMLIVLLTIPAVFSIVQKELAGGLSLSTIVTEKFFAVHFC